MKTKKQAHAFKGYASFYKFQMLNSFNPEIQLKDTKSAIKNKVKKLFSQLRVFTFVTTLVLVFKKTESEENKI